MPQIEDYIDARYSKLYFANNKYIYIYMYITKKNFGLIHVYFLYKVFRVTYRTLISKGYMTTICICICIVFVEMFNNGQKGNHITSSVVQDIVNWLY